MSTLSQHNNSPVDGRRKLFACSIKMFLVLIEGSENKGAVGGKEEACLCLICTNLPHCCHISPARVHIIISYSTQDNAYYLTTYNIIKTLVTDLHLCLYS